MGFWIFNVPIEMDQHLKSESYKFIRMADDLHDVARYLNDMRLCFIALTVTGYIVLIIYGIIFCVRRNRRQPTNAGGSSRRARWDYQIENRDLPGHGNADDLVSVRSDGGNATASYMGRNHSRNPASFMRHGMNHTHQTARLMPDQDGGVVKHQLTPPNITTEPPRPETPTPTSKIPELVKGSVADM
ncbi:hypothetical protein AB6A40_003469 [Gnathostoma spinigerum]|uniref:Uncharacterized protein n=1 Tax=Gnathostoma spinigerum TaxID=75299 RepID=A0ABD6E9N4_9BILA